MKLKKLISFIIISLCSFQMAFAQTIENARSVASVYDLEEVLSELSEIKKNLRGNVSSDLSEEELGQIAQGFQAQSAQESEGEAEFQTEFITFLDSIKKNSCGVKDYQDEQRAQEAKKTSRGENLFSSIASVLAEVEVDAKLNRTQNRKIDTYSKQALNYFTRAKSFKTKIEDIINNTNEAYADKEQLLLAYNDSVVKGLYDIKVILSPFRNVSEIKMDQILPKLTTDFIEEETELYNFLVHGEMKDKIFFTVNIDGSDVELKLNSFLNSKRDVVTVNESPSAKSYLRALRILTIQMMATQIKNYDLMIESEEDKIVIPKSCRSEVNGSWPQLLELKVDESVAKTYLDNLINNSGLSYDESNLELMSVREAEQLNPLAETMVASTTVENFLRAAKGKEATNFYQKYLKAGFDEVNAYNKFVDMKMGEIAQAYKKNIYSYKRGTRTQTSKQVTTKDIGLINDIIGVVPESKTIEVDIYEGDQKYVENIYPSAINASPYLASKMAQARTENLEDIISDSIKNELKNNKVVIEFPSLYSQESYRNWGLNTLYHKALELQDSQEFKVGSRHNTMLFGFCYRNPAQICKGLSRKDNVLKRVVSYIDSLKIDGKFIPVARLDQSKVKESYVTLAKVFDYLRTGPKVFSELVTNEYDYLLDQMQALNPLAKVRLGYLVAREELQNIRDGQVKTYKKTSRGMRVDYSYKCFNNNMKAYLENLEEAAEILKVNRSIKPNFLTNELKKDEYARLWNTIFDEFNKDTTQIMTAELNSGKKAFELIDSLSNKVTLDRNQIEDAANETIDGRLLYQTTEDINERLQEEDVEKVAFFKEILAAKSHKERSAIFDSRPDSIDIFDDYELVHNFLKLNMDLKTPVYKEILKRSALKRQQDTYKKLNKFCQIDEDDIDSLKENFYATVKIQDQLNQLLGIPAVPKELMDRMDDWNSDEKWAMFNGVFGFLLGMGAVLAAGSCTLVTGGLCGLAIASAGAVGFGMQANAIRLETKVKFRADRSEEYVGEMAELGYTDSNSTENVAKGWMAVAFEVIGTISMISILTRSVSVGSKIFKESLKAIVKNRSQLGIKEALKQSGKDASVIVNESEVEFAKLVLGLKKYSDVFKKMLSSKSMDDIAQNLRNLDLDEEFVEKTLKKMDRIEANYTAGKLSQASYNKAIKNIVTSVEEAITRSHGGIYRYTSDVAVNLNYSQVDEALGSTVSKLFNGSPLELRHYMGSYVKRLNSTTFSNSSKAARSKLRVRKADQGHYMRGTNWIVRAWNENTANLAKNRRQFLKIYDELQRLPEAELADYIAKNADTLTEIFVKIPLRKRDFPYMLIQGAPHTGGFFGKRLPVISAVGEGVLMRKIFTARARLISEVARRSARETLGMKKVLMAETVGDIYRGLEVSVLEALPKMSKKEVTEVETMIATVKEKAISGIVRNLENDRAAVKFMNKYNVSFDGLTPEQTFSELNRILYSPNGTVENTLSRYLWASADVEGLFKSPEFSGLAYKVMRDTMKEENIGSLQRYLNALKVLKIKDNGSLGSVEIF
ncbi:hypothetical protein ABMA70_11975 [Halobacteriovorax sp. XZX-3]|uniref:hypothetical protein n=1 Tax=unclassified Halobacteriovorax TaxID=2639665 RepID=UPI00371D66F7